MKKNLPTLLIVLATWLASNCSSISAGVLDTLVFDMSQVTYNNDYASIPVYIQTSSVFNALDFSMKFDESSLTYDSTFNIVNYLSSYAFFNTNDHTLRFTSSSIQPIESNKLLVRVRFIMLNGKKQLNVSDFNTMKGLLNGDPCSVKMISELTTGVQDYHATGLNAYPNPAASTLTIEADQKETIQLVNMNGKIIFQLNAIQGQQEISTEHMDNGVYMLRMFNDKSSGMKKIVIDK